jgi:hypothetical protein
MNPALVLSAVHGNSTVGSHVGDVRLEAGWPVDTRHDLALCHLSELSESAVRYISWYAASLRIDISTIGIEIKISGFIFSAGYLLRHTQTNPAIIKSHPHSIVGALLDEPQGVVFSATGKAISITDRPSGICLERFEYFSQRDTVWLPMYGRCRDHRCRSAGPL